MGRWGCGALIRDVGLHLSNWGRAEGAVGLSCEIQGCKLGIGVE